MFSEDLWMEILSKLPVKSLIRFSCINKYFQSLISNPSFVKLHLQNSPKNTHLLLRYSDQALVIHSDISSCFEDSLPFFFSADHMPKLEWDRFRVFGSCNGLVCLCPCNHSHSNMVYLWNPATKKLFGKKFHEIYEEDDEEVSKFGFGYDNSRDTYKLVTIRPVYSKPYLFSSSIYNMENQSEWRDIQNFPDDPTIMNGSGIYLNNTLNWVGLVHERYVVDDVVDLTFSDVVIVSLDLHTETYTRLLLPSDLSGVIICDFLYFFSGKLYPYFIGVLDGCLSLFLDNIRTNHISIWQMKEFGNQNSWSRLLNTSLQDLGINPNLYHDLTPLYMVKNDHDIIMIHKSVDNSLQAIVYNQIDKTVKSTIICGNISWIYPFQYVESLVSPFF